MNGLAILISSVLLSSVCFTQDLIPSARISEELQSFYQHPSASLLARIVLSVDVDPSFRRHKNAQAPYVAFLVVAFGQYPSQFELPSMVVSRLLHSRDLVLHSLDLSKAKDTILNWPNHSPATNDMLWGGFFASGDTRYLGRLVSEMRFCDTTDSLILSLTGGSAKWSLRSNAQQYPEVKRFLQKAMKEAPANLLPHIREALELPSTNSKM